MQNPQDQTDAEMIAASLTAPDQFGRIFSRHFDSIHRFLFRRAGQALADDLAAETFFRAFDQRSRYDLTRHDARPWLFGIAVNLLRGHYRAEERQLRAFERAFREPIWPPEEDEAINRVDAAAEQLHIGAALAALHRRDREVLLLYAWEDFSYAEIAEALRIPTGTVRSRLNRARAQFRASIYARGQGDERMAGRTTAEIMEEGNA